MQMTKSGRSIKVFLDADGYTITVTDCGSDEDANVVTVRISLTSPLMRSLAPDQVDGGKSGLIFYYSPSQ